MNAKPKKIARHPLLLWDRPERESRPPPSPLSRERIVRAAIGIADKRGLASVSLRKIGASLNAGPMRLYGYIGTKKELLELMVDAIYGEMTPNVSSRQNWRDSLRSIAQLTRQSVKKHHWFIDLLGGRPHLGPNALVYLEASLSSFSDVPMVNDVSVALQFISTFNAYVIGAMRREVGELMAELESGMDKSEWQARSHPYMTRMMATGRFPTLSKVLLDTASPLSSDTLFEQGLDCVLDGIGVQLERRSSKRKREQKR